jgi:hypothetical protein
MYEPYRYKPSFVGDTSTDEAYASMTDVDEHVKDLIARAQANGEDLTFRQVLESFPDEKMGRTFIDSLKRPIKFTPSEPGFLSFGDKAILRNPGGGWTSKVPVDPNNPAMMMRSKAPLAYQSKTGGYQTSDSFAEDMKTLADQWAADFIKMNPKFDASRMANYNPFQVALNRSVNTGVMYPQLPQLGGQNYIDYSITRNPVTGGISSVNGLNAIDLGALTPEQSGNIADVMEDWVVKNFPYKLDKVKPQLDKIRSLKGSGTVDFYHEQNALLNEITNDPQTINYWNSKNDVIPKEDLWDTLINDPRTNWEATPHEGGKITSSGINHQAMAFNRPEQLSGINYIPSTNVKFTQLANSRQAILARQAREAAMLKYTADRGIKELGQSAYDNQMKRVMADARLAGINSMLVGSANNTARNR